MKNMKTKILLLVALVLAMAATLVSAQAPGTGIRGTAHDFSSSGGGVGLCTFCHTPHRGIGTRLLWNHTLSTATYTWQDIEETIGGTRLPTIDQSWTGPTKFCLSCHDGSVAIGDVNWWLARKPPVLNPERHDTGPFNVGATGGILGNMSGNHPVAVPYPYQQQRNTYNGVTTGEHVIVDEFVADPTTVNKIRLFNNQSGNLVVAGALRGKTGIECSSCHDPHNGSTVEDVYFIRGRLRGNSLPYICLKCHAK